MLVEYLPANAAAPAGDGAATLASLREDSNVSMLRIGHSAPEAVLRASAFSLALSPTPGHALDFRDLERTDHPNGMVSLYARDPAAGTETAIVIDEQDVSGRAHDEQGNTWRLTPLGGGLTAVYRYDTSNFRMHPPGWDPGDVPELDAPQGGHATDGTGAGQDGGDALDAYDTPQFLPHPPGWDPGRVPELDPESREHITDDVGAEADTGNLIDVMVLYTRAARIKRGNIDSFLQEAFDNARRHYENSDISFRLRRVLARETSYVESGNISNDLVALGTPGDGHMDEVQALRDRHGADLVHLFISGTTPSSGDTIVCGVAPYAHTSDLAHLAFGVTAVECESGRESTFTHEIGHNQGAAHDIANVSNSAQFSYGYGNCNSRTGWATVMAYVGINNSCTRQISYFSSPSVRYQGVPTGDAQRMDNRRVLVSTARAVANHRQSTTQQSSAHTLPMVPPASNLVQQGFVRVINNSNRAGDVRITAIDDRGQRFGPVTLSLEARAAKHFSSQDLENGNPGKGLSGRAGNGYGNWWLELATDLEIEHLAYVRTRDGFVTNMHEVAAEIPEGSNRYHVPFLNPGKNRNQESKLRLINPGSSRATIEITGLDDNGRAPPLGPVRLTLDAGNALILTAGHLENGHSRITGRLGAGAGKWRLSVSADRPIQVMSLLELPTGHLTNLSRGQDGVSAPTLPANQPDLVVQSPSVNASSLNSGQSFTFSATVRNQGSARSAATTLRYFRSSDATISSGDSPVGTDAVGGLAASDTSHESVGLTAPSSAGTYYYGACVDSVSGEADTRNNCSSAVAVTVTVGTTGAKASYCNSGSSRYGAIAPGWKGQYCEAGFGWGYSYNYSDRNSAISRAESECRGLGLRDCGWVVVFTRCGAMAYGESSSNCGLRGGLGATRFAAEQDALSECRADFPDCQIPVGTAGSGAGAPPPAQAQSGSSITDSPFGAPNPGARPEPKRSRRDDGG